jgi:hypothetical protein
MSLQPSLHIEGKSFHVGAIASFILFGAISFGSPIPQQGEFVPQTPTATKHQIQTLHNPAAIAALPQQILPRVGLPTRKLSLLILMTEITRRLRLRDGSMGASAATQCTSWFIRSSITSGSCPTPFISSLGTLSHFVPMWTQPSNPPLTSITLEMVFRIRPRHYQPRSMSIIPSAIILPG